MTTKTLRGVLSALLLALLPALTFAQGAVAPKMFTPFKTGGSISSGSAVSGCTAYSLVYIDSAGNLACAQAAQNSNVSTAGNAITQINATISGSSATSNFLNITGTFPATLSAETNALYIPITLDNDNQAQNAIHGAISGTSGTSVSAAIHGRAINSGTWSIGLLGDFSTGAPTHSIGVLGYALGGAATSRAGGFFSLAAPGTTPPSGTAALMAENSSVAANIFEARDNGTAVFTVQDGGSVLTGNGLNIINGNGGGWYGGANRFSADAGNALSLGNSTTVVATLPSSTLRLTASTMTASKEGEIRSVTHSYSWTNAMVTALGASLTGDINVATLPAKTRVDSALVVIDTAAGGVTTLTVSCGDAIGGTPFTNYIVASDAKAAANTVYGDLISGAETGASLFDATTKWRNNYVPSYTSTTLVTCHFISTGTNLNTVTTSTGHVILTTTLLP